MRQPPPTDAPTPTNARTFLTNSRLWWRRRGASTDDTQLLRRNRSVLTGAVLVASGMFIFSGASGVTPVITLGVWGTLASAVAGQFATWG